MKQISFKNTVKVFTICAVAGALFLLNTSNVFAATGKKHSYRVDIHELPCNGGTRASDRNEEWKDSKGQIVYRHYTDCDGKVTETGKKPLIGPGDEMFEEAKISAIYYDISIGEALAMNYPPTVDSIDTETNERYLQFDFPIEWVYEIANVSVSQTNATIKVETDTPIQIQIVNLQTGLKLTKFLDVYKSYTFDISHLGFGCIYSIVMQQYIPEANEIFIIKNHNFCK